MEETRSVSLTAALRSLVVGAVLACALVAAALTGLALATDAPEASS